MYVIIAYDVAIDRINALRSFLRTYVNWVQNSVFEGDLTESELIRVENGIRERIDPNTDNVLIYCTENRKFLDRKSIGMSRAEISTII